VRHLVLLLSLIAAGPASAQELPAGSWRDEVTARCTTCHASDMIAQQRLSAAGWGREVDKMIRWGASVATSEREGIVAYLAARFSPAPAVDRDSTTTQAEGTYKRACVVCHDADLIDAQRLTRPGWTREVDKMVRWGANVSDADKGPLIDYLAGRFRVR
jgi:mono/diheme cytochrome c family protein